MKPFSMFAAALMAATLSSSAIAPATVATNGHATNPVWYHDSTALRLGGKTYLAWTTNAASVQARTWVNRTGGWVGPAVTVSTTVLNCHCKDSTGTNPNRHDVPAIFADPAGRIYMMYGGGTAAYTDGGLGPYFRAAASPRSISGWGPEQNVGVPGAVLDMEAVRNNLGTNYVIGQQGANSQGAGSLILLRVPPGTSTDPSAPLPYQVLVKGGRQSVCTWKTSPSCDVFTIGRIALGPADPLNPSKPQPIYVVWGWSEASLSSSCGDPSGFCNRGLYMAESLDGGSTWRNAAGSVSVSSPIPYGDPNFEVVAPTNDVGLFKAVAVSGAYPGTPWIAYQPNADLGTGEIVVTHLVSGTWSAPAVVDQTRAWNNHLVMRATSSGNLYIWSDIAQTGTHATFIAQWTGSTSGGSWPEKLISVGANWFLTGTPAGKNEVLMWRGASTSSGSDVRFALVPVS